MAALSSAGLLGRMPQAPRSAILYAGSMTIRARVLALLIAVAAPAFADGAPVIMVVALALVGIPPLALFWGLKESQKLSTRGARICSSLLTIVAALSGFILLVMAEGLLRIGSHFGLLLLLARLPSFLLGLAPRTNRFDSALGPVSEIHSGG